ncbi:MAG: CBS domain-containing protein [Phycisphaerae bacterium]|nr:CBS domain-containing protein [Phycisphaerae bacterium]
MKIKEILAGKPNAIICSIAPERTIADAIALLCEKRIGALMVEDTGGQPLGIITERDMLRAANQDIAGFGDRRVADVMTRELICGLPDDNAHYVMQVMTQNKIRHLPIVENHRVIGLISIGDVIKSQLESARIENHMLKDYLHLRGEL